MSLDVEVACVEVSADIKSRDEFEVLESCVSCRTLVMEVKMVGVSRCLTITLLERFPVPYAVTLIYIHMVHMDRDPYVACCVCDLVVYVVVDDEVVGLCLTVTYIVYARFLELCEVESVIIVLVVFSPVVDLALERYCLIAIRLDLDYLCCLFGLIVLVELDHCNLRLVRHIAHL